MGWLELTELNEAATITGMKPVSEGGTAYIVKHSDSEWLLLENRQQTAWDAGAPGKGLVIYHVNYDGSVWQGNEVNIDKTKRRFHLVHADNMDYDAWSAYIKEKKLEPYAADEWMNRRILSTSPYPYISEDKETVNNELTDTSTPAATMFNPGTEGEMLLAKPITNIQMTDDGLISFDFMGGTTGIRHLPIAGDNDASCLYNLQGQRINIPKPGNLYIVKKNNGTTYKYIK